MDGLWALLLAVLGLLVIALLIGFVILTRVRRQRIVGADASGSFSGEDAGDPRRLRAGDVVEIHGVPYTVRGSVHCAQGCWARAEHLLDDASGVQLGLSVVAESELKLAVWTPLPGAELVPGPETLDLDGRCFKLNESGKGTFHSEALPDLAASGEFRYYDYRSSCGALLFFGSYDNADWAVSTGELINQQALRIYPAARAD
ncbi:uncharacterized protein DUF4178 [Tamaricihabitans halophyticus]|uniref:Uncharacterized protein DUF4178 n=1 Tax=Tamaricihabitans halophyticus TaxID=1262583 RepID=A0A4R2R4K2_9PSEU|nr:DUF4178 domain-containing protein [Tamaricihabitans halophyticus]TCP56699.1 uncharacterized protein DUF4178 [Tamaricihabitans halophyticus]